MVAPAVVMAAVAAGQAVKSHQDEMKRRGASNKAMEEAKRAGDNFRNMEGPDLKKYEMAKAYDAFDYRPQDLASPEAMEDSSLEGFSGDPRLAQAQMSALANLGQVAEQGMTAEDLSAIQDIQAANAAAERGDQAAIMQDMSRRGMGGSGSELAQRMLASQAGADRAAADSRDVSRSAQERALQAMIAQGNMGTNIRGQEFSEADRKAQAADAINRFNVANRNRTSEMNWEARNQADLMKAQNRQNIANVNTDMRNTERAQHNQLEQQKFDSRMGKETGAQQATQAATDLAKVRMGASDKAAAGTQAQTQAIGNMGMQAASSYFGGS